MKKLGSIVNTRPGFAGEALSSALRAKGFEVHQSCPITIGPIASLADLPASRAMALDLDHFSDIVITSVYAAHFGLDFLADYWPQWPEIRWWAIGAATEKAMSPFGITAKTAKTVLSHSHIKECNSELFLKALHTTWQQDNENPIPKALLVMTGANGRGLIQSSTKSICKTQTLECYRRIPRSFALPQTHIFAIILTSIEIATAVFDAIQKQPNKIECFFICASDRIATFARSKGAGKVINSASAQNEILVSTIENLTEL